MVFFLVGAVSLCLSLGVPSESRGADERVFDELSRGAERLLEMDETRLEQRIEKGGKRQDQQPPLGPRPNPERSPLPKR